jgi:hypothetical protein
MGDDVIAGLDAVRLEVPGSFVLGKHIKPTIPTL